MTWHAAPTKTPLICGSCRAGIWQVEGTGTQYAKTRAGLIRCRRCAEMLQGWCSWPKGTAYLEQDTSWPRQTWAQATQPWERVGRLAVDWKARQHKDGHDDDSTGT